MKSPLELEITTKYRNLITKGCQISVLMEKFQHFFDKVTSKKLVVLALR